MKIKNETINEKGGIARQTNNCSIFFRLLIGTSRNIHVNFFIQSKREKNFIYSD